MRLNAFSKISKNSQEDEVLHYLNGVFMVLGILNSFSNDSKSLHVRSEEIEQGQKLRQTLKMLTNDLYEFEITKLDSFSKLEALLEKSLPFYVEQQKANFLYELSSYKNLDFRISEKAMASIENKFCEVHYKPKIKRLIIVLISYLIKDNDNIYAVQIDEEKEGSPTYEMYHNDYIIINNKRVIHIHLGGSD